MLTLKEDIPLLENDIIELSDTEQTEFNPLGEYIVKYNINLISPQEKTCITVLRYLTKIPAVLLGSAAGIPWIASSIDAGNGNIIGYIIAGSMVIAFGATTVYSFLELTKNIRAYSTEEKLLVSKKNCSTLNTIICHILGLSTIIPTAYIAFKFNDAPYSIRITYTTIASFVSYVLSTFGFLHLKQVINNLLGKKFTSEKDKVFITTKEIMCEVFQVGIIDFYNASKEPLVLPDALKKIAMTNESTKNKLNSLFTLALNNEKMIKKDKFSKNYLLFIKMPILLIIPTINTIFYFKITIDSLQAISNSHILPYILSPVVAIPLWGLDLFSLDTMIDKIGASIHRLRYKQKSNSFYNNYYPWLSKILFVLCLVICIFSAYNDGYIAKTEMSNSVFKPIGLLFQMSVWLSKTTFETLSLYHVSMNIVGTLHSSKNDSLKLFQNVIHNFQNLINTVSNTDNKYITAFVKSHPNIMDNRSIKISDSKWSLFHNKNLIHETDYQKEKKTNNEVHNVKLDQLLRARERRERNFNPTLNFH